MKIEEKQSNLVECTIFHPSLSSNENSSFIFHIHEESNQDSLILLNGQTSNSNRNFQSCEPFSPYLSNICPLLEEIEDIQSIQLTIQPMMMFEGSNILNQNEYDGNEGWRVSIGISSQVCNMIHLLYVFLIYIRWCIMIYFYQQMNHWNFHLMISIQETSFHFLFYMFLVAFR